MGAEIVQSFSEAFSKFREGDLKAFHHDMFVGRMADDRLVKVMYSSSAEGTRRRRRPRRYELMQ